jgi:phosphoglycolate phosphatase
MNKNTQTVLFDFDGVLVDTFDMCFAINNHFHPGITEQDYKGWFHGNIYETVEEEGINGGEDLHGDGSYNAFWKRYVPMLMQQSLLPTMERIIPDLAKAYRLAVVTSSIESPLHDFFEEKNVRQYFLDIFDMQLHRSKVVKLKMAMEQYTVAPDDCIFVTDTLGDIREATKAGMQSIGVTWGFHDRPTLAMGDPHAIIDNPDALVPAIDNFFST